MTEGWVKVFSSADLLMAKLAEDVLKQNGIESHIANMPDSVLPFIGSADLYTTAENAESALEILAGLDLPEGETE